MRLTFGDFGKGFVHEFDEKPLETIFSELDTMSDFLKYLSDKEEWFSNGKETLFAGEETSWLFISIKTTGFQQSHHLLC